MRAFKPAVVIPVYNHPGTIARVVREAQKLRVPIYLVDDGSNEETRLEIDALAGPSVTVLRHRKNRGKGAAVSTGMRAAKKAGFTHALQVDADAQHDLAQLPAMLKLAEKFPCALICGAPEFDGSAPAARRWGRRLTNFWVAVNGLSCAFEDAMCGLRVYPLEPTVAVLENASIGERMEFDPEILVRLLWAGVRVKNVPVRVTYPEKGVSHFRAGRDNVRISFMHAKLFLLMISRLPIILWSKLFGWAPECECAKPKKVRPAPCAKPRAHAPVRSDEEAERAHRAQEAADRAQLEAERRLKDISGDSTRLGAR